jgi:hypothetical protein
MTAFVPPELISHSVWREAHSALPDAPVVPDEPRARRRARGRLGGVLRALARRQLRLADRLDPSRPGRDGEPARA